jgi:hypothetical protein
MTVSSNLDMQQYAKSVAIVSMVLLLVATLNVQAQTEDISAPNKVPDMSYFRTSPDTINPGTHGKLNFTIMDRYQNSMYKVNITVEVYKWATIEEAKNISKVHHPPVIKEGQDQKYEYVVGTMAPGIGINIAITLETRSDTPEGTYFVRTMMTFEYGNGSYVMKSRGYFTNAQWEAATDQLNLNQSVGGINITYLGVDGILVDTSFSVKKPMPMWPLALLIGLTVLFAVLAVVLYLVEEEKGNTKLKKMFFPQAGKVQQQKMLLEKDLKKRKKKGTATTPPPTEKTSITEEE